MTSSTNTIENDTKGHMWSSWETYDIMCDLAHNHYFNKVKDNQKLKQVIYVLTKNKNYDFMLVNSDEIILHHIKYL